MAAFIFLDQAMLNQLLDVGVHIGIVATYRLGYRIDRKRSTNPILPGFATP